MTRAVVRVIMRSGYPTPYCGSSRRRRRARCGADQITSCVVPPRYSNTRWFVLVRASGGRRPTPRPRNRAGGIAARFEDRPGRVGAPPASSTKRRWNSPVPASGASRGMPAMRRAKGRASTAVLLVADAGPPDGGMSPLALPKAHDRFPLRPGDQARRATRRELPRRGRFEPSGGRRRRSRRRRTVRRRRARESSARA